MQLVQQFDTKFSKTAPHYSEMATVTLGYCRASYQAINNFCQSYASRIQEVTKASMKMKNDIVFVMFQTTEDFLEFIEGQLQVECPDDVKPNIGNRIWNFLRALRNIKFAVLVYRFLDFSEQVVKKTKQYSKMYAEKYLFPTYVSIKATFMVSRELFFEIFHQQLTRLKMTYKIHKDTITMFLSGDITKKIIQKIKQNLVAVRQLTVNFVQKGLEIKVTKKELVEHFHSIMSFLAANLNEVAQKSLKRWQQTRKSTLELYQSTLERIREKKFQIKVEMGIIKARPILQWSILDIYDTYYNS